MNFQLKGLVLAAGLFVSSLGFAQQMQMRTPKERAQSQVGWMQKNLNLTDDQNTKVYDVLLKYAQQVDNARNAGRGPDRRAEMQEIQKNREADLKAVLTGEQYQKYQAHEQEMRQQMIERRQQRMEGGN